MASIFSPFTSFLQSLKKKVKETNFEPKVGEIRWNRLYIVGHSLGAHVASQVSTLLKKDSDSFFHVEKITGLDPAGPCFKTFSSDVRLDKKNADFVEVIHTQHSELFSLGSSEPVGK